MKSLRAQHAETDNKEISDLKKWRTERAEAVFRQYPYEWKDNNDSWRE